MDTTGNIDSKGKTSLTGEGGRGDDFTESFEQI